MTQLTPRERAIDKSTITAFRGSTERMVMFVMCQADPDPTPCTYCRDLVNSVRNAFRARTAPRVNGQFARKPR